jgi:hypothetical protein
MGLQTTQLAQASKPLEHAGRRLVDGSERVIFPARESVHRMSVRRGTGYLHGAIGGQVCKEVKFAKRIARFANSDFDVSG